MSLERVERVKNGKFWRPFDILLYGILLAFIVISFVVIAVKNASAGEITGVEITYENAVIGRYTFADGWQELGHGADVSFEITENGEKTDVVIYTDRGYNRLTIDGQSFCVYMEEADCAGEDCVRMKIEKATDFIICVPHRLVIAPLTADEFFLPPDVTV